MNVLTDIDWNLTPSSVKADIPVEDALSILEKSCQENPIAKKRLKLLKTAILSPTSQ